ncbi:MAG TPA: DUF1501 domain-containing protein [Gemmataceae bacterium]
MFRSDRPNRRDFLRCGAAGLLGVSLSGWMGALAARAAGDPARKRSCILLWMNGGPSQMDTFDLKPGHENGGPFKEIQTSAPGLKISEHLPNIAKFGHRMAVVRSMTSREGDHGRASYLMRTGNLPMGAIQYPTVGSLISKELGEPDAQLPNFVSISPFRLFNPAAYGPGFLGPKHAPLIVGDARGFRGDSTNETIDQALKVQDLTPPPGVTEEHADARFGLLRGLEEDFAQGRANLVTESHRLAYQRAVALMRSEGAKAFDLTQEPDRVRDRYGRNLFGQGCLLARRLVERGVPFVEVSLFSTPQAGAGWDTHSNNFEQVKALCGVLDPAWAALMSDLEQRGLLDSTLIVWMGEFGRTPRINRGNGRDHYPNAYSAVLAGGGIRGGQAIGRTSADGTTVEERPVQVTDFLATVCLALGIDYYKTNDSNIGRPIPIVDKGAEPIREVVA